MESGCWETGKCVRPGSGLRKVVQELEVESETLVLDTEKAQLRPGNPTGSSVCGAIR